ncbi:protein involved in initiation of plasmid replication [Saprospira grandis DSM 2844]|uniref:Protein involved in initiation of plasmid replication n=1 Tax=Saprospira grandis DSM 2844 TaxID=694433 RepID=J1I9T2_9BACT|nr:replication initiation protein [Saprospira grandis]EJF55233.1 protein involved in initiation of plasmid replication [Saprospira grandis DSM 2844]
MEQKNERRVSSTVREANELIEASYRFSVWEDRIFLLTLSQIQAEDDDFKIYKIYVKDLAREYGLATKSVYENVREAVSSLQRKTISIPFRFDEGQGKLTTSFFTSFGELDQSDFSHVLVELHPKLKPYLLQLKERFTQYNISFLVRMQSHYSKRIYKLLKQYHPLSKRRISIQQLKQILQIEPEEYKRYFDFKRRVILKAQEDLAEYTDLKFEFEEERKGRKVQAILFTIDTNEKNEIKIGPAPKSKKSKKLQAAPSQGKLSAEAQKLFEQVEHWGLSQQDFEKYLKQKTQEEFQTCIDLTLQNEKVKNRVAYLVSLLKKENLKAVKKLDDPSKPPVLKNSFHEEFKKLEKDHQAQVSQCRAHFYQLAQAEIQRQLQDGPSIERFISQFRAQNSWMPLNLQAFRQEFAESRMFQGRVYNLFRLVLPKLPALEQKRELKIKTMEKEFWALVRKIRNA